MYGAPGAAACHKGPATGLQTAALQSLPALPKCRSSFYLRTVSEIGISHSTSTSSIECCESRSQQSSTRICLPCNLPVAYGVLSGTQSSVLGCSSLRKHSALLTTLSTRRRLGLKLRSIRQTSFTEATSDETSESRPDVVRRVIAAADAGPVEGGGVPIEVWLLSPIIVYTSLLLHTDFLRLIYFDGFF